MVKWTLGPPWTLRNLPRLVIECDLEIALLYLNGAVVSTVAKFIIILLCIQFFFHTIF